MLPQIIILMLGFTSALLTYFLIDEKEQVTRLPIIAGVITSGLIFFTFLRIDSGGFITEESFSIHAIIVSILAIIWIMDVRYRRIDRRLIFLLVVLGTLNTVLVEKPTFPSAIMGGALGWFVFYTIYRGGYVYAAIVHRRRNQQVDATPFGFGDVLLAGSCGVILGVEIVLYMIAIALLLGSFRAGIYTLLHRKQGWEQIRYRVLPYAPYIITATLLVLWFGDFIQRIVSR